MFAAARLPDVRSSPGDCNVAVRRPPATDRHQSAMLAGMLDRVSARRPLARGAARNARDAYGRRRRA
jgi:hypothetical protein